jgi:hypothetical protein
VKDAQMQYQNDEVAKNPESKLEKKRCDLSNFYDDEIV